MKVDCAVIGGGIIGLSVAMTLLRKQPGLRIVVLEKEDQLATHQSGRNSGVIHSGIYYSSGSLKARFACDGNRSMIKFCRAQGIEHEICGKVIVATNKKELPILHQLYNRGLENGLSVKELSAEEVRELEPHLHSLRGIHVPSTGIVDYRVVCSKYAELTTEDGGSIRTCSEVSALHTRGSTHILETPNDEIEARFFINCGGLQSDRLARRAGLPLAAKIIPFRGEYYELTPEKRGLVNSLIYPVPNPAFPFLGVHFTKMIDGSVHAGPNAVLALQREGYRKTDVNLRDLVEMLTYKGLWKLARKYYREGFEEIHRSLSKRVFLKSLQRLIPELTERDLLPTKAGVRAQALAPDGELVSDFLLIPGRNSMHVCNAPSPAATASLEIGQAIVAQLPELRSASTVSISQPTAAVSPA
jgi:L-2-hydroxyglutarate oxidase